VIEGGQARLEDGIEEVVPVVAQEDEELGAMDPLDDRLFGRRQRGRWLPEGGTPACPLRYDDS
jgi:hypothetical protein